MIKAVIFDMYETLITQYDNPVYFSAHMAKDAGMSEAEFQSLWRRTEEERTTGQKTVDEVVEHILKVSGRFTEEKLRTIMGKRIQFKQEAFRHLHPQILPMMEELKRNQIKIALISNCYSEEAAIIRKSILHPYFDAVCLSYEEKMQKPDLAIYQRCLQRLDLAAEECFYIGDGGSHELDAAARMQMHPAQALWYLKPELQNWQTPRLPGYEGIALPMDVPDMIKKYR